jgi:hypothetical protein
MSTVRLLFRSLIVLLFISCKGYSNNSSSSGLINSQSISSDPVILDGTYCADVRYYNSSTGKRSSYTLTVVVSNNEIIELHWPNGGKLDGDDFAGAPLDENGYASFTNKKGYEYQVQLVGPSEGCFSGVPMAKQCKGKTKSGSRCKHMTDNSTQLCWQHQNQ